MKRIYFFPTFFHCTRFQFLNSQFMKIRFEDRTNKDIAKLVEIAWANVDSTHHYYSIITGILTLDDLNSIIVYPNPTNDKITIESNSSTNSFELYDLAGKLLLLNFTTTLKSDIDLSNFSNGIYFLTILQDGKRLHKKIIKD